MGKVLAEALGLEWRPEMDVAYDPTPPVGVKRASTKDIVPRGEEAFWFGRRHTPEQIEANRKAHLGLKKSEVEKAAKRRYKHTDKARLNISKNHAFKNGRPGHSERMSGERNPGVMLRGKTWKKDPVTGKRIWIGV